MKNEKVDFCKIGMINYSAEGTSEGIWGTSSYEINYELWIIEMKIFCRDGLYMQTYYLFNMIMELIWIVSQCVICFVAGTCVYVVWEKWGV